MLVTSVLSFSNIIFKSLKNQGHENAWLFGGELNATKVVLHILFLQQSSLLKTFWGIDYILVISICSFFPTVFSYAYCILPSGWETRINYERVRTPGSKEIAWLCLITPAAHISVSYRSFTCNLINVLLLTQFDSWKKSQVQNTSRVLRLKLLNNNIKLLKVIWT